jgi:hypothetical protein
LVPRGGRRRSGEGGAGVWCLVSRHGMARARRLRAARTVAGGARHTGCGVRAANRGGGDASDAGASANRWGATMRGAGGQ